MKEQAPLLTLLYCRRIVAWKSVVVGLAKYSAYGPLFHAPKGSRSKLYYSVVFEGVYVTVGNPAFCIALYLTGVHFRGKLQHVGDVSEWKIR